MHVVVHRLRDRDHRHAFLMQAQGEREGVVAADRDQRVQAESFDHAEHVIRVVAGTLVDASRCQERRLVRCLDLGRVRTRGMQERPPRAVDRPHHSGVERQRVGRGALEVVRLGVEQAAPSAPDADDLVPLRRGPVDHRLDRGIRGPARRRRRSGCRCAWRKPTRAGLPRVGPGPQSQRTCGRSQSSSGTVRGAAPTSATEVVTIFRPTMPTMLPHPPCAASSMAAIPRRVASTRS